MIWQTFWAYWSRTVLRLLAVKDMRDAFRFGNVLARERSELFLEKNERAEENGIVIADQALCNIAEQKSCDGRASNGN